MNLTEKRFLEYMESLPNGIETIENGKVTKALNINRGIVSKFSISYHIIFPNEGIQYNVWFDKLSFLNSTENVTISKHDNNQKFIKDKLKNIFSTTNMDEFKKEIDKILKYENSI